MRKIMLIVAGLVAGLLCACATNENMNMSNTNGSNSNMMAHATPTTTSTPARGVPPRHDDRAFVLEAGPGGLAEVELGKLAAQKGQSADVKRFGQRMVSDHSKANAELKKLAASKGITLPAEMNAEQKAERDKLAKLSGPEFDREYMALMVEDHDKDVAAFEEEAKDGSDPDIKSFAAKTLPTLQEHQRMSKEIKAKL
jgi:putative membrane protein